MPLFLAPVVAWAGKYAVQIAMALTVAFTAAFSWLYIGRLNHEVAQARADKATAAAHATISAGQTQATTDAATIASQGARRDALTITLHEDHANALQSTPGASAPVSPVLNAAGRRGLCGYAAYAADPGCVGLLGGDSAKLPAPGRADPTPGY